MNDLADKLKSFGYDFALRGWYEDNVRYFFIAWKPGNVKETTITLKGDDAIELFEQAIEKIAT